MACWASHTPNSGSSKQRAPATAGPHLPTRTLSSGRHTYHASLRGPGTNCVNSQTDHWERKTGTDVALAAVAGFMGYVVNQRRRAAEKYTASATRASPRSKRHPTPRISLSVPRPTRDLSEMASQKMPKIPRARGVGGRRRRRRLRNWLNFLVL